MASDITSRAAGSGQGFASPRHVLSEAEFQDQVMQLARLTGWRTNHVRRTIGKGRRWTTATSAAGWPDLALWRPGRFFMAELKTDSGHLTAEQHALHESLRAAGIDVRVWRPRDWPEIEQTLKWKEPRDQENRPAG